MSEEFCAGVRILIERMQTNPEDFADEEHDLANMRRTKMYRFGAFASRLERIITGHHKDEVLAKWPEWHYLTQAEQDALIEAFKAMRRTEFDKRIMERVFDDKFYERQEEEERQYVFSKTQQAQLQAQMRASEPSRPRSPSNPRHTAPLLPTYTCAIAQRPQRRERHMFVQAQEQACKAGCQRPQQ